MAFDVGGGRGKKKRATPSMNVTPLVDVVLVLLIIFMVITPMLAKQFWVHVPAEPEAEAQPAPPSDDGPPVVTVDAEGVVRINHDEVPLDQLEARLHRVLAARSDRTVFFDAASDAPYGRAVVLHHYADSVSADPNGFEADNNRTDNGLLPRSNPTIYNATIIGCHDAAITTDVGMVLRRGTYGSIHDTIVTGWGRFGVDARDMMTTDAAGTDLLVDHSIIFGNALDFEASSPEEAAFMAAAAANRFTDPMIANPFATDDTVDYTMPETSIAATGAVAPPSGGFFGPGEFVGAIGPGCPDWTAGWTSYPVD